MKIESEELLTEFHNKMIQKYPGLNFDQAKEICYGPWKFLKQEIESGELPKIRFKYFGVFQVYSGRAKIMLEKLEGKTETLKPDNFNRIKNMLKKFIENEIKN